MSVYTSISDNEFSEILTSYSLGQFISAQGIQAGVENTNYFITTSKGDYVFTLFEKINQQELNLYISLLQQLAHAGIACPQPRADIHQQTINFIKGKPFIFVSRLKGENLTTVNASHCEAIATELAKLHTAPVSFSDSPDHLLQNRRGKIWREITAKKIMHKLSENDAKLLSSELMIYESFDDSKLPRGIIHADLFKDNAIFNNKRLSGIIDLYDACYDSYLYDIAITINAWCTNEKGELITSLVNAFLNSYQVLRPLTEDEKQAWPIMLRIAAMRFWISRLEDFLTQRPGDLTHCKNPDEYQCILKNHVIANQRNNELLLSCG